jgi:cytosine/adenosine deaminase-related metal-dependent hydrolase
MASKRLSSRDVFEMATINGAKALKMDDVIGSISEGKFADLTVLDFNTANLRHTHDPLTAVVHRARMDNVKFVLVEGEVVYDRDLGLRRGNP